LNELKGVGNVKFVKGRDESLSLSLSNAKNSDF